jgi:hypothetical protein
MAEKVRGVVDVIFLIDATGSMGKCIDALKNNIRSFFQTMVSDEGNGSPVKDWRAKVVGFRDFEEDGSDTWLINNPFTKDVVELEGQLSAIRADGGGDIPESLLDALYKLMTMGETGVQEEPMPYAWRPKRAAARVIVIFTDAPYKPTMTIPEAKGLDVETIFNEIEQKRIILSIFAPDEECYLTLSEAPRSEYMKAQGLGLDSLTADPANFAKLMKQLAKSVSQSATVVL